MHRLVVEPLLSLELVRNTDRLRFVRKLFGAHFVEGEQKAYWWMAQLTQRYAGGLWDLYSISNGGGFMSPKISNHSGKIILHTPAGATVYVSDQAAGIIVTLLALSHLAYEVAQTGQDPLSLNTQHALLRDFAAEHAEAGSILQAAD